MSNTTVVIKGTALTQARAIVSINDLELNAAVASIYDGARLHGVRGDNAVLMGATATPTSFISGLVREIFAHGHGQQREELSGIALIARDAAIRNIKFGSAGNRATPLTVPTMQAAVIAGLESLSNRIPTAIKTHCQLALDAAETALETAKAGLATSPTNTNFKRVVLNARLDRDQARDAVKSERAALKALKTPIIAPSTDNTPTPDCAPTNDNAPTPDCAPTNDNTPTPDDAPSTDDAPDGDLIQVQGEANSERELIDIDYLTDEQAVALFVALATRLGVKVSPSQAKKLAIEVTA